MGDVSSSTSACESVGWQCRPCGWKTFSFDDMHRFVNWPNPDGTFSLVCPRCGAEGQFIDAHKETTMTITVEQIARVCHETNRGWCEATGDFSQVPWEDAASWQRESAVEGVSVALAGATPDQQHEAWCDSKRRDGWVYGDVKDADAKTHPCLVAYADLPAEQKIKDGLFIAVVSTLTRTDAEES